MKTKCMLAFITPSNLLIFLSAWSLQFSQDTANKPCYWALRGCRKLRAAQLLLGRKPSLVGHLSWAWRTGSGAYSGSVPFLYLGTGHFSYSSASNQGVWCPDHDLWGSQGHRKVQECLCGCAALVTNHGLHELSTGAAGRDTVPICLSHPEHRQGKGWYATLWVLCKGNFISDRLWNMSVLHPRRWCSKNWGNGKGLS